MYNINWCRCLQFDQLLLQHLLQACLQVMLQLACKTVMTQNPENENQFRHNSSDAHNLSDPGTCSAAPFRMARVPCHACKVANPVLLPSCLQPPFTVVNLVAELIWEAIFERTDKHDKFVQEQTTASYKMVL